MNNSDIPGDSLPIKFPDNVDLRFPVAVMDVYQALHGSLKGPGDLVQRLHSADQKVRISTAMLCVRSVRLLLDIAHSATAEQRVAAIHHLNNSTAELLQDASPRTEAFETLAAIMAITGSGLPGSPSAKN